MASKFGRWWQKIRSGLRWLWQRIKDHPASIGVIAALLLFAIFVFLAYTFDWDWTGFNSGESKITITSTSKGITTATEQQPMKSFWDWLGLAAIPLVVGLGGVLFTNRQEKVKDAENTDNQRETALQAYIDKISDLLLHECLLKSKPDDDVRTIAKVRTLTVLRGLDAVRKASVLQFLYESGLVNKDNPIIDLNEAVFNKADLAIVNLDKVYLSGANLSEANLSEADLTRAKLSSTKTNVSKTNLFNANLLNANLLNANLGEANLSKANLSKATLIDAILINADLTLANLSDADLTGANLTTANLAYANLTTANLKDVTGITKEELEKQAK